jgi:hypothetical protein
MVIIPPPVEKVFSLLAELLPRLVKKGKMGGQDGYMILEFHILLLEFC